MKKPSFIIFAVVLMSIALTGCGKADMEGFILEVNNNDILLAKDISLDKYKEIKNKSEPTLVKEGGISLTYLEYDNPDEWEKGNKVKVWIDGTVQDSFPSKAKAKKITEVKE